MDNRLEDNWQIIALIAEYMEQHPTQRFGQILFNLNVNQFSDQSNPGNHDHRLRDIYNDYSEVILERIKDRLARSK
jgi:hypothetical protein